MEKACINGANTRHVDIPRFPLGIDSQGLSVVMESHMIHRGHSQEIFLSRKGAGRDWMARRARRGAGLVWAARKVKNTW